MPRRLQIAHAYSPPPTKNRHLSATITATAAILDVPERKTGRPLLADALDRAGALLQRPSVTVSVRRPDFSRNRVLCDFSYGPESNRKDKI
jgi:hypothetical protein